MQVTYRAVTDYENPMVWREAQEFAVKYANETKLVDPAQVMWLDIMTQALSGRLKLFFAEYQGKPVGLVASSLAKDAYTGRQQAVVSFVYLDREYRHGGRVREFLIFSKDSLAAMGAQSVVIAAAAGSGFDTYLRASKFAHLENWYKLL